MHSFKKCRNVISPEEGEGLIFVQKDLKHDQHQGKGGAINYDDGDDNYVNDDDNDDNNDDDVELVNSETLGVQIWREKANLKSQ